MVNNLNAANAGNPVYLQKRSAVRNPSTIPMIQEIVFQNNFIPATFFSSTPKYANDDAACVARNVGPATTGSCQNFTLRHSDGGNILWFDTHVSFSKYDAHMKFARTGGGRAPAGMGENQAVNNWLIDAL
jgi:prepilin-type processing-associated H-X9-DG protein